jgi:hypothetical protein
MNQEGTMPFLNMKKGLDVRWERCKPKDGKGGSILLNRSLLTALAQVSQHEMGDDMSHVNIGHM